MMGSSQESELLEATNPRAEPKGLRMVNVYLRLTNKYGKKISIPQRVQVKDIMQIVQLEYQISRDKQVIYLASQKLISNGEAAVNLQQGSILHIHFIEEYQYDRLALSIQQVSSQGLIGKSTQHLVDSSQLISQFIKEKLDESEVVLVESGRKLDNSSTFKKEQVCNKATIYYYYKQKELNHDEFQKDFNKLFEEEEENQKPSEEQNLTRVKDQRQKRIQAKRAKRNEASSSQETERLDSRPNFKKKKSICLKAVKKNPEDSNYTWKRDISFSQSKSNRKLAKALKGKRKRQSSELGQKASQNEQMSMTAKIKLRQEFRKLFMSDTLGLRPVEKNKPSCSLESEDRQYSKPKVKQREFFEQCQSQPVF